MQLPHTPLLPAPLTQTPSLVALCSKTRQPLRVPRHGPADRITAVNVSHSCTAAEHYGPTVSRHTLQCAAAALRVSMLTIMDRLSAGTPCSVLLCVSPGIQFVILTANLETV
jgi:hypothetical protein